MMRDQRAMRDARARLAALTQRAGQLARQQQDKVCRVCVVFSSSMNVE